jgi:hypothetical protein
MCSHGNPSSGVGVDGREGFQRKELSVAQSGSDSTIKLQVHFLGVSAAEPRPNCPGKSSSADRGLRGLQFCSGSGRSLRSGRP